MEAHSASDLKPVVNEIFKAKYGAEPQYYIQAPGRVNLMGEHTDYNDGFVLPCAIHYRTLVAVRPRKDSQIQVVAADYPGQSDLFSISPDITEHKDQLWSNYVRGVVKYLAEQVRAENISDSLTGADLVIAGNVPQGSGLSSSASLEVAIGETLSFVNGLALAPEVIARIGQQAENDFVGCRCGIMDQMASACGEVGKALMLDCRSLETKLISMPTKLSIMIINSNVKRGLVDSEYNIRRQQCEQAAQWFQVKALRDIDIATFHAKKDGLDPVVIKRAQHIVTENERTLAAAEALQCGDVAALSKLMAASHESMKTDFEITVPELDLIVDIVSAVVGNRGGARMTGGGFGGCAVALVPNEQVTEVEAALNKQYESATGLSETVYVTKACGGAGYIDGNA